MAERRIVLFSDGDGFRALGLVLGDLNNSVGYSTNKRTPEYIAKRFPPPVLKEVHADALKAIDRYQQSAANSIRDGWHIVFTGQPSHG